MATEVLAQQGCSGDGADHCCYLLGKVCKYLEEDTIVGRRWVCGLMRELGDWDAVILSDRYKTDVATILEPRGVNCRDFIGNCCSNRRQ